MTLADYLVAASRRPWVTGTDDCTTHPADWAATWGGGDPMAAWRGRYSTDEGALHLVEAAGGLVALFDQGLRSIGATVVDSPDIGDVGVIHALGEDRDLVEVGAIFTGPRWSFRSAHGLIFASAEPLKVWRRG